MRSLDIAPFKRKEPETTPQVTEQVGEQLTEQVVPEDVPKNNKITFPITITKGDAKEKEILELITNNPALSAEEIARHVGLTRVGARYHINNLKKKGIIRRKGHGRGGSWEVSE